MERNQKIKKIRFVFDSNLNRLNKEHKQPFYYPIDLEPVQVAPELVKAFKVEALLNNGNWKTIYRNTNNYQRLVKFDVDIVTNAVRFVPETTWGAEKVHLFAWDVQ